MNRLRVVVGFLAGWSLICWTLAGCSTLPQTVEVPIAVPCTPPPAIQRPQLSIRQLKPGLPPAEVKRLYAESMEQLGGYATELETLLNGYRERSNAR